MSSGFAKENQGFTLVELIVVIVILGVLSAVALPRFIDFSKEAKDASVDSIVSTISSAMSINYAACVLEQHDSNSSRCVRVNPMNNSEACSFEVVSSVLGRPIELPEGYVIGQSSNDSTSTGVAFADSPDGTSLTCTLISMDDLSEFISTGREPKFFNYVVIKAGNA